MHLATGHVTVDTTTMIIKESILPDNGQIHLNSIYCKYCQTDGTVYRELNIGYVPYMAVLLFNNTSNI